MVLSLGEEGGGIRMMFEVDSGKREDAVVASLFAPWTVTTIGSLLRLYMELDCFAVVILLYALRVPGV